jgi:hypothetical protein
MPLPNPQSEARNPKQIQNSNSSMFKMVDFPRKKQAPIAPFLLFGF